MSNTSRWTIETATKYITRAAYHGLRYWSAMDYLRSKNALPTAAPAPVKRGKAKN